ncbi:SoxR reducing system RseC family protein [Azorhizophilus paspali]|uniref:SoxR reducing system RseC family protein n=1 Tax=Azorhizophilus paspali TaxID=69963 RepID=A0ABV6SR89_AZOPA
MIEELGRVVAIEPEAVWIEALDEAACPGCTASVGCGRWSFDWLETPRRRRCIRALSVMPLRVGDAVVVGIREDFLLRSSLAIYLLPLLGLFVCTIAIQQLGFRESLMVPAGFLGFVFVWAMVRRISRRQMNDPTLQPVVLRALLGASEGQVRQAAF